ncbi:protein MALE DISCOVERER 2-like [Carex rostrata]
MDTGWWSSAHRLIIFILLFLCLLIDQCSCINLEGRALYAFRVSVEVDPFRALDNWDPHLSDPCSWKGVHCIGSNVETLNLTGFELVGTLAPELGRLIKLRSLILSRNHFYGSIPKEIGDLKLLEVFDVSLNRLSGEIPSEVLHLPSLKKTVLSGNNIKDVLLDEKYGSSLAVNRKINYSSKGKRTAVNNLREKEASCYGRIAISDKGNDLCIVQNTERPQKQSRRMLIQELYNLPALLGNSDLSDIAPSYDYQILSAASGAFSASVAAQALPYLTSVTSNSSGVVPDDSVSEQQQLSMSSANSTDQEASTTGTSVSWSKYVIILASILIVACLLISAVLFRKQAQTAISPWKTGLSAQLQRALVIQGVQKLDKAELELACEDFSNIINDQEPCYTVFKGTLSNGTEIAVISTNITNLKDWSIRAETCFCRKIDMLRRVSHKNFVNLLGYCEEDEPFMRMMVLEYAPNGTLHDHLHIKEFETLEWGARMRIIMGMSYCLQHMHQSDPPVTLPCLRSNTVFLTDDYAAKLTDMSVWTEVMRKRNMSKEAMDFMVSTVADCAMNIYTFGLVLLEIISGRQPERDDEGASILSWANHYLDDKREIKKLLDPTLKKYEEEQLVVICQVIQECVHPDPTQRPSMRQITKMLREVIDISPEAAYPRLSPLWWAELEILSVEAG